MAAGSKCVSNVSVQGIQRKRFQPFEAVDVWSFIPRQKGPHMSVMLFLKGGKKIVLVQVIPRKELPNFISCIISCSFHYSILPKLLTFLRENHTPDPV